jgi:hypothetical protein
VLEDDVPSKYPKQLFFESAKSVMYKMEPLLHLFHFRYSFQIVRMMNWTDISHRCDHSQYIVAKDIAKGKLPLGLVYNDLFYHFDPIKEHIFHFLIYFRDISNEHHLPLVLLPSISYLSNTNNKIIELNINQSDIITSYSNKFKQTSVIIVNSHSKYHNLFQSISHITSRMIHNVKHIWKLDSTAISLIQQEIFDERHCSTNLSQISLYLIKDFMKQLILTRLHYTLQNINRFNQLKNENFEYNNIHSLHRKKFQFISKTIQYMNISYFDIHDDTQSISNQNIFMSSQLSEYHSCSYQLNRYQIQYNITFHYSYFCLSQTVFVLSQELIYDPSLIELKDFTPLQSLGILSTYWVPLLVPLLKHGSTLFFQKLKID